jgi:hypothetical protein
VLNGRAIFLDRGKALEDALKRGDELGTATLLGWKRDAIEGKRPAVIFNSTIVETGQRMLYSTTDLYPDNKTQSSGLVEFHGQNPQLDVGVAAAVRLSATFPVVSPAARAIKADVFERSLHTVDGGYSDNYGMASLVEWLNNGLESLDSAGKPLPSKILIIELRASPQSDAAGAQPDASFGFQLLHPLYTLYEVRDTGQLSHNELERELVRKRWAARKVAICPVVFQPPASNRVPPLNWHLTVEDQIAIRDDWNKQDAAKKAMVGQFIRGENCTCP